MAFHAGSNPPKGIQGTDLGNEINIYMFVIVTKGFKKNIEFFKNTV